MACYHPITGYKSKRANPFTGKRSVVFNPTQGFTDLPVTIPCGQCIGCRLERSRQWAIRCVHEASMHENNCFITLTYSPQHLPNDGGLKLEDFQKFMKRLRKEHGSKIRFFHCGEYGEVCLLCGESKFTCNCGEFVKTIGRPHYHACLFNFDFKDKKLLKISKTGEKYFTSVNLDQLWGKGFTVLGDVTFESAAYVARYITKKVTGPRAESHYEKLDRKSVGEIIGVRPEYTTCSRRPGIGADWYKKYRDETFRDDYVVLRGRKMRPPKFYDKIFENEKVRESFRNKVVRKVNARKHEDNNTPERLEAREFCQEQRFKQLKRGIEK